ncbi:MAG: hypothetical protein DRO65_03630, partial [Candidatus Altiarchaeales archaeon]
SKCLREKESRIYDIKIYPINKTTVKITWKTDKETFGSVWIEEQDKVDEILKKAFHCNFTGNLVIEKEKVRETLQKCNCSFVVKNNETFLVHNGNLYGFCLTSSLTSTKELVGCIFKEDKLSKNHSVVLDILQPDTEYSLKIRSHFYCEDPVVGFTGIESERIVKFKMS